MKTHGAAMHFPYKPSSSLLLTASEHGKPLTQAATINSQHLLQRLRQSPATCHANNL